jgi:hypothetical protein
MEDRTMLKRILLTAVVFVVAACGTVTIMLDGDAIPGAPSELSFAGNFRCNTAIFPWWVGPDYPLIDAPPPPPPDWLG